MKRYIRLLITVVLAFAATPVVLGEARARLVESLDTFVPQAPVAVTVGGKRHLVYELHLSNARPVFVTLTRVEIRDGVRANVSIADLRDSALDRALEHLGARSSLADRRKIGPGQRVILYLWLPLDGAIALPSTLSHSIEFDILRPNGAEHVITRGTLAEVQTEPPIVLSPPLRGGRWVALYDPSVERGHRRALYTIDGRARIPARFATDWVKLGEDGALARGDTSLIANYHGYGAEVLAVADGIVAAAMDDIDEAPSIAEDAPRVTLENASGNYVSLDLGNGHHVFYEHLKRGSVRVKVGDRVKRGQVIGLLGNSGSSSSGPHLHFHVSDASSTLGAEGLPYVFSSFNVLGSLETMDSARQGEAVRPLPAGLESKRRMELPAANAVVEF